MQTAAEYWKRIANLPALREGKQINSEEIVATLRDLDVTSHAELLKQLPVLTQSQRLAAIKLLGVLGIRRAGPALVACWLSDDADERWEASRALQEVQSRLGYRQLFRIVNNHPDPRRREDACYILAFSQDNCLLKLLQEIYADPLLLSAVRAQAAEGFANHLDCADRRSRRYRQTLKLLLSGLQDPAPEVRFWTCFALGTMRARQALAGLQRIVEEDEALCPGWWYVREEAFDAICHILNKPVPERQRIYTAT